MRILTIVLISLSFTLLAQKTTLCFDPYIHPIVSSETLNESPDLEFLHQYIVDKDMVSLGEATHGSHEIFTMKHRLIKHLVEHEAYTIITMEANMAEAELLNTYIQTGEGDPNKLLANLGYWVWNTQEVLDLIIWMKEYNHLSKHKIKFMGFDMQSYKQALKNIKTLYPNNNNKLEITVNRLNELDLFILSNQEKGIFQINDSIKEQMYIESNALFKEVTKLDKKTKDFDALVQNSKLLLQYSTRYSIHRPKHGYRDLCMAQNIKWIKDHNKNSKIIIWAHNGHVKRAEHSMGKYLMDNNIKPYVIGFSIYEGEYTAIANGKFAQNELSIPDESTYEYYFNASSTPTYFIDVNEILKSHCKIAGEKLLFREIGSMKRDEQFYNSDLTKEYDGIVNIRKTSGSKLLYKY